jgi:murein L,D-transpeptidase YafK
MKRLVVIILLGLNVVRADELPPLVLRGATVFPGDDGASASTLALPLLPRIRAHQDRAKTKRFAKKIVVHKARRRLDVFADDELLKSYVVNLGLAPLGPKEKQGDARTPEGELFICSKNRVSQYTRFLELAYPTPADAHRGVQAGLVKASVEADTRAAWKARDRCPPQTTALGGAVGIHGKGVWKELAGAYAGFDWTLGCVGLRDEDILELFNDYAEVGVPVIIFAD